jgi:hypothetical protein
MARAKPELRPGRIKSERPLARLSRHFSGFGASSGRQVFCGVVGKFRIDKEKRKTVKGFSLFHWLKTY